TARATGRASLEVQWSVTVAHTNVDIRERAPMSPLIRVLVVEPVVRGKRILYK
ncbi:hypothetical protein M378DRAFT_171846, partial [Amanita muscaria Koide BX008]